MTGKDIVAQHRWFFTEIGVNNILDIIKAGKKIKPVVSDHLGRIGKTTNVDLASMSSCFCFIAQNLSIQTFTVFDLDTHG